MAIRVLVADDNALIRKQIRSIVESDTELEICAEACRWIGGRRRKLRNLVQTGTLTIDIEMPVMDGLKATRRIKRLMPLLPILLLHTLQLSSA